MRKRFWIALAASIVAGAGFTIYLGFGLGDAAVVTAVDDIGEALAAILAAAACASAASLTHGKARRGWALMAASAASWSAGQVVWSWYEIGLGQTPFPSVADVGFLVAMPLSVVGVLSFWTAPRGTSTRWRIWLDLLIVAVSLTFVAWVFGLKQVYFSPDPLQAKAIELAYPVGDILIGSVLILGIRRATREQQGRMLLLLAGIGAISISDSVFVYALATEGVSTSVIDAGWVFGYLMIALAAIWPAGKVGEVSPRRPIDLWQIVLPWTAVLVAAASAVTVVLRGELNDQVMTVLAAVLGGLLMVSQVLTHKDSASMLARSQASEETLTQVIDHAPIGIARAGTDFKVISASSRLAAMFGEPITTIVGSPIAKYVRADVQVQYFEALGALMSGAVETVDGESPMVRVDGSQLWVRWTSTAVRNAAGKIGYFLTMLEDTTARHEAEQAAKASLESLERLNKLKTEFMQSISHEFKTALTGIHGFAELIRDADQIDALEVKAFAGDIYKDADRLDRLVTEMLAVNQDETDRANLKSAPVDLNVVIGREVVEARKGLDGVALKMNLQPALPTGLGDRDRLSEVVRTLLHNAIRYSPDGGQVTISTRLSGNLIEVTVEDRGLGDRAEFDTRLFGDSDIYTNSPMRKIVGTGLGLSIARRIVDIHGGRIWVDRIDGVGSEFHFTLPIAPTGVRTQVAPAARVEAGVA